MIKTANGNLLKAETEALVNAVNTVGVMGKGLALQFRHAFPDKYFKNYQRACRDHEIEMGRMHVFETGNLTNPRYIVNFSTKKHWRNQSLIEDIRAGLVDLVRVVREKNIKSIAVPPLGCGLGGLRWNDVRPLIEAAFEELPEVEVLLYAPDNVVDDEGD